MEITPSPAQEAVPLDKAAADDAIWTHDAHHKIVLGPDPHEIHLQSHKECVQRRQGGGGAECARGEGGEETEERRDEWEDDTGRESTANTGLDASPSPSCCTDKGIVHATP